MGIEDALKKTGKRFDKAIHGEGKVGKVLKEDVGRIGKIYLTGAKAEGADLKKIMKSENLVFYKTDAFVIVLRKLGGLYDFLKACDGLTKEGYTMVNSEDVFGTLGRVKLGSFYYFQHKKYIY
jgi:hypothetical protein